MTIVDLGADVVGTRRSPLPSLLDLEIAEAIFTLGRSLGVTVVAEGVETADQQSFLSRLACNEMQGFHFHRPSTPEVFADLFRTHVPQPRH